MHIGYSNQGFDYRMEGHQLERIEEEKDLGVWITSNMKSSLQCSKAAAKAMAVLAQVRKAFQYMDYESFNIIYRVYVRPHLEYCVQGVPERLTIFLAMGRTCETNNNFITKKNP